MYLKQMEVVGFKSFADPIKLDFEPGLTAIVGPNGCGKSNIIDAIRWCLGEMSAKSLRSSQMLDVVFNGSGTRPAQNLAEVTLTFDNSDKQLPIDYSDVSITRKLFRSGESEYFINKTQCRLRDIKELFLDTGMGEDGYSSMEQGRVEWILQAKPEDRRELFEEAAGVSKYRARREEALRKLERVDIDLSRLADIISVTQDQIRKLENAVSRAQTYQRVREQLKSTEIADWLFHLDQGQAELESLNTRLSESMQAAEALNTDVHTIEANLAELRLQSTQTEEELVKANTILAGIDADVKIGEERLTHAKQREQDLEQQIRNVNENIAREQARITQLQEQETSQAAALEQLKTEGGTIEQDFVASKTLQESALATLETKRAEVKAARDLILERAQQKSRLQNQLSQLTSDTSRLESEFESREKEVKRSTEQAQELTAALEALTTQCDELKNQTASKSTALSAYTEQIQTVKTQENTLRLELMTISEDIARLKGQIHSIQDQQSTDPYLAGTQAILNRGFERVYGPLGKLIQASDVDRDLIAAALGEHLGDMIAETTQDAEDVINYLKSEGKGRARIWILERIPTAPSMPIELPVGEKLLDRIRIENRFEPLLAHLMAHSVVQENTVYAPSLVNGGIDPAKWKSHIPMRLPELESQLARKETRKTTMEISYEELKHKEASLTAERESALKEMEEVRIRLELSEEEKSKTTGRLELSTQEQDVIKKEIERIISDKQLAVETRALAEQELTQLETQEKDDHYQLDLRQQEMTELQQVHVTASADLSAKQERYNSFNEKLQWQESILTHTRRDLEGIKSSIVHHQESAVHAQQEIGVAKTAQAEAQTLVETSLANRNTAFDECSAVQSRRAKIQDEISQVEASLSARRSELSSFQESIQTERIHEAALKGRLETIHQKLNDQYELNVERARASFQPAAADVEALEKLKKRVAGMGPVNLAAPQEHAELVEKNTFLTTQQTDLIKAKDDLREVIAKINATTREHFRETFQKVRENFRILYSELFRGGEADLHFTNEADILSTGIDIFCQPPGKKLLHISLLSGGEKALTAVALLFAFFQVRPSPLALLDEVDAPLDEANVVRYVEMVKKFSLKSQFLMITHNKRTMEAANTMYGVTMESLGVSRVISARLASREKNAPAPAEPAAAQS